MSRYKTELLKRMKSNKSTSHQNLASFLSIKNDIAEALEEKIPMSVIHKDLVSIGRINFGYVQFTQYVKKHINKVEKNIQPIAPIEKIKPKPTEFKMNPVPNKEDLY